MVFLKSVEQNSFLIKGYLLINLNGALPKCVMNCAG